MLLIYDPTSDLSGAETEAHDLTELFQAHDCQITTLKREECTKDAVLAELGKGTYDLLHYAGHASFTKLHPEISGILLHNDAFLCAADLEILPAVPRLIFLNACQSGRVRDGAGDPGNGDPAGGRTGHASLAEGFILRNVAQFIGTYWLVNDAAAGKFAVAFYTGLLTGKPIGGAVRTARQVLEKAGLSDWVNYLHFGDPGEPLRKGRTEIGA